MNNIGQSNTSKIIALTVGTIFVALSITAFQIYLVDFTDSYDVDLDEGVINFTSLNSSSIDDLKTTSEELEDAFSSNTTESGIFAFTNWFDTTWQVMKGAMSSVYNSLKVTRDMISGGAQGIFGIVGGGGYIVGGLIVAVMLSTILIIIGWWMNR